MPELYGRSWKRGDLLRHVGRLGQVAGVRLVELGDGAERGVRVLEFRTGTGFAFDVIVDRAFDIGRCELGGRSLAWDSGVGFAGPWFYEWEGLGFMRNWGGGLPDHVRDRPHAVHGRGHRRAVPLPAKADRGVPAPRPLFEPPGAAGRLRRAAGRATTASSGPRARRCRRRSSASICCCGGGSRPGSANRA